MAASLLIAFARLWSVEPARTGGRLFHLFVVAPISIYSGWLSVAIFANTASIMPSFGGPLVILASSRGSILLILAAAVLAATLLRRSHNNLWYAGTILWALAAIAIRNQFELRNTAVAVTAWTMLVVFAVLTAAMLRMRLPSNAPQRRRG